MASAAPALQVWSLAVLSAHAHRLRSALLAGYAPAEPQHAANVCWAGAVLASGVSQEPPAPRDNVARTICRRHARGAEKRDELEPRSAPTAHEKRRWSRKPAAGAGACAPPVWRTGAA